MTPAVNLRLALRSLAEARGRNALAFAGLALGIAAVVAMLALTLIVRTEALRQFDATGLDVLVVRKVSGAGAAAKPAQLDFEVLARLPEAVAGVEVVAPLVERRTSVQAPERPPATLVVAGVTEAFFALHQPRLAAGRPLTVLDERASVVVLGRDAAASLGAGAAESWLGRPLTIEGRICTVVGVLAPAPRVRLPSASLDQAVLLPASAALRLAPGAEIGTVYVRHDGRRDPAAAAGAVADFLQAQVSGLAVQVSAAEEVVAEMTRQLRLYALFFGAVGSLSLVLAGFAIMNGLLLAVSQRRTEIGLRRALGALRADVQAQFLYEALLLGGAGGATGVVLGVIATGAVARYAGWELTVPAIVPLAGMAVALGISALAGFFPAFQAARLDPAVAMQPER